MTYYKEILRLSAQGISVRNIALSLSQSRNTVAKVLKAAAKQDLRWPTSDSISEADLEKLLFPVADDVQAQRMPDFEWIHAELAKSGVTLMLLWYEYCEVCRSNQVIPYQYNHFCRLYKKYAHQTKATMRIQHKPGEKLEVDWAGQAACLTNSLDGSLIKLPVFVAVLPYSGYAYVEVMPNMKMQSWIQAHINCFDFMGGVAKILVPDNLKTGVDRVYRNESVINKTYNEMASYYGTIVLPARIRRPKDKASVEGTVGIISTSILAALRNRQFFSIQDLNSAIREKLAEFNANPFQVKEGSRESVFLSEEQELLLPLPIEAFELSTWVTATVAYNYHVRVDKRYYSVPYEYIHQKVDIRVSSRIVEIFFQSERIASHRKLEGKQGSYQTNYKHMPKAHQEYHNWDADKFVEWGQGIGPNTEKVIKSILASHSVEQQSYRTCMAILNIEKKHGSELLEDACQRALIYTPYPSVRIIKTILASNETRVSNTQSKESIVSSEYAITRDTGYYGRERNE